MKFTPLSRLHALWLRMTFVDVAALVILAAYAALSATRLFFPQAPQSSFFLFLAVLALGYLAVRGFQWAREHLLWSLRNRLVIAYLFIAVVPVLLLLTMARLGAYLLYWQLGSYVLYTDMQERIERLSEVAATLATSYAIEAASGHQAAALALPEDQPTYLKAAMTELPGLKIETGKGENLLRDAGVSAQKGFSGLVLRRDVLNLRAVVVRTTPSGPLFVSASVPVTPEFIETLAPEVGPIQVDVLRPKGGNTAQEVSVVINRQAYSRVQRIGTRQRSIPPAVNPFDKLITGIVVLDMLDPERPSADAEPSRLFASFSTRPSLLNRRLFSPLGELGGAAATALLVIGAVFLVIEFASLMTGIVLTRTITTAVDDLYRATQHVQAVDLSFRVRVPHPDQFAALGGSFNSMMQSVASLIE